MRFSPRTIRFAAPILAALLLTACRAEPAANNSMANAENTASPEDVAAPVAAPPAAQSTARYRFTGTEPFWGGTIDGTAILYQTPDDQAGKTINATIAKAGMATLYSGMLDGQPFVLTLTPGTCSDGMSDTVYPISAALTVHGEQRQGCANPIVGAP